MKSWKLSITQMVLQLMSCLLRSSEGEGRTAILVKKISKDWHEKSSGLWTTTTQNWVMKAGRRKHEAVMGGSPCAHGVQWAAFGVQQRRLPGKCGKPYKCVHCTKPTAAGIQLSHLSLAGRLPAFCIWENGPVINHPVVSESQVFSHEEPAALQVMGGTTVWQGSQ